MSLRAVWNPVPLEFCSQTSLLCNDRTELRIFWNSIIFGVGPWNHPRIFNSGKGLNSVLYCVFVVCNCVFVNNLNPYRMFSTSPPILFEQILLLMTSRKLHMRFL